MSGVSKVDIAHGVSRVKDVRRPPEDEGWICLPLREDAGNALSIGVPFTMGQ
jgi:hypothetical protein